jgi:hypothetical protein
MGLDETWCTRDLQQCQVDSVLQTHPFLAAHPMLQFDFVLGCPEFRYCFACDQHSVQPLGVVFVFTEPISLMIM